MRVHEPLVVENVHFAGAVEIARWPVTCERSWFQSLRGAAHSPMLGRALLAGIDFLSQ